MTALAGGFDCFFDEGINDRSLERSANVGKVGLGIVELLELIKNGGFEAGEREVKGGVFEVGSGKGEGFGISFAGVLFDFGPAGVGAFEHAADLVEGFAGRVIDGSADELVLPVCLHIDEHGVAAGNDEAEVGWDGSSFEEG